MKPRHLQDSMMNWYDFDLVYVKGSNLTIAVILSRVYLKSVEGYCSER